MTFDLLSTLMNGGIAGGITGILGAVLVQQVAKKYLSDEVSEGLSAIDVRRHDHLTGGRDVTFHSEGVRGIYRGVSSDGIVVDPDDPEVATEVLPLDAADGRLSFHDDSGDRE